MNEGGVSLGHGVVRMATDRALCIALDGHGTEVWVPLSVLHDDSEVYGKDGAHHDGEVVVQARWARKNQLP